MHTVHSGFSVVAPLKTCKDEKIVKEILTGLNNDPGNNFLPFSKSPSTLSASGIVIPVQPYGEENLPATLLLFTSYCGSFQNHLDELIKIGAPGLRQLFQYCIDFPPDALTCDQTLKKYLISHRSPDTYYSGIQHISSIDIKREEELRKEISEFLCLNQQNGINNKHGEIRKQIQKHIIEKKDEFLWAQEQVKITFMDYWVLFGPAILYSFLLLILLSGLLISIKTNKGIFLYLRFIGIILLALIAFFAIKFRLNELDKNQKIADQPNYDRLRTLAASQNHLVINEMTAAGPLKKGWIRRALLRSVLKIVSLVTGLVNITTVVSARWLSIDRGKRLVFISNYANMSESYVRDFIDRRSSQKMINLLFGHCEGYPPTKWLLGEGAINNLQGFMNVVQTDQHVAQLWYCTYNHLSADNIKNNRKIRNGLFAKLGRKEIEKWLRLL